MTVKGQKQYSHGAKALAYARRLSEARMTDDMVRQVLGRDRQDRATTVPKVSLPKLKFLERPMPDWDEPPRPRRGRS
jgi:hypothetical protein